MDCYLFKTVFTYFMWEGVGPCAGKGSKSVIRKACTYVMRADYFCFPLFCCLEAGGQIIEDREYMFISPFLSFSSPPLLVTPFSSGIKQAAQPHFSNLLQSLIREMEELWSCACVQPAWPLWALLGAAGLPQPSHVVLALQVRSGLCWCCCPFLGTLLKQIQVPCEHFLSLRRCTGGCRCSPSQTGLLFLVVCSTGRLGNSCATDVSFAVELCHEPISYKEKPGIDFVVKIGAVGTWGWLTCDVLGRTFICFLSSGWSRLALPAAAQCLLEEAEHAGFSMAVVASAAREGTLAQLLGSAHHGTLLQRVFLLNADAGAWRPSSRACAMSPGAQ